MKTIFKNMVLAGFFGTGLIGFNSCTKQMDSEIAGDASILNVTEIGASSVIAKNLEDVISETVVADDEELTLLVNMKEEEKLARDVYSALSLTWNNQIFSRISEAENTHMNAIIFLLGDYGTDYTQVLEPGKFSDSGFQLLFDELVAKGSVSIEEAYKVGALIEEMDITDLIKSMNSITEENITLVFENLEKGSRNHLRAFTNQLNALGLTYTPVYLSATEYEQIVSTPTEKGKQYKMQGNGNGKAKGKSTKRSCTL